jgi:Sigma-70, region 4
VSATIGDLIDAPLGNRYLIPWQWLTANSKKTMEIVFQFAFDEEQDFSRGFAIHHLKFIELADVKAIKYLDYKYVQLAIEEIQKLVSNKKYSDLPTLDDSEEFKESTIINKFEIYDDLIRKASNIEDLSEAILDRLDAEFPMSERDKAVVCARAGWFTSNPQTLDSIGKDYGLTRERIRQITKKYENPKLQINGELRFAKLLSQIAVASNSLEDLQENGAIKSLTGEDSLDIDQCREIMTLLSGSTGWDEFRSQFLDWDAQSALDDVAVGTISKYRSKMGFIDAAYAAKGMDLTLEKVLEIISEKYPRSVRSDTLVLARTEKLVSTFESSVYKQLLIMNNLPASEILVGVRRYASLRKDAMSGLDVDYVQIINLLCGNPPTLEELNQNQLYQTELSESDKWLIGIFNSSPSGLLHRVEITRFGIESSMNLGSVTAYCGSSPFIRLHSNGVYSLIGKNPSDQDVSTHAELALAQDVAVDLQFEFQSSNILLTLKPNLNTYASGVLLPGREIKDIFKDSIFTPSCICGLMESKQLIRLSKEGFWLGFQSFFAHALQNHGFTINSQYELFFDFDLKSVTLDPKI